MRISFIKMLKSILFCSLIAVIPADARSTECVPDNEYFCVLSHDAGLATVARFNRSALHEMVEACQQGAIGDCIFAGSAYRDAVGDDARLSLALDLLEVACSSGDSFGCLELGKTQWKNTDLREDAVSTWRTGCSLGAGTACNLLAWGMEQGVGGAPSDAFEIYNSQCQNNDYMACTYQGKMLKSGKGSPQNLALAADLFDRSCRHGYQPGCFELALAHFNAAGRPNDPEEVHTLLADACDRGHADSCGFLGVTMIMKNDGQVNKEADQKIEKGCQFGSNLACNFLQSYK